MIKLVLAAVCSKIAVGLAGVRRTEALVMKHHNYTFRVTTSQYFRFDAPDCLSKTSDSTWSVSSSILL